MYSMAAKRIPFFFLSLSLLFSPPLSRWTRRENEGNERKEGLKKKERKKEKGERKEEREKEGGLGISILFHRGRDI